jgi:hypothetical protein
MAASACSVGNSKAWGSHRELRAEARPSRQFRTAVPILVATDELKDLCRDRGSNQGLGLGLALGLVTWALLGFVLGVAYSLGAA